MSTIRVRNFSPDFSKTKIILNGKLNLKLNFHLDNLKKSQYKTLLSKKLENDNMRNKGHYLSMNLGTKIKDINDDKSIRINIKILSITKQWSKEYQNIKQNGYNGYNNKKQQKPKSPKKKQEPEKKKYTAEELAQLEQERQKMK